MCIEKSVLAMPIIHLCELNSTEFNLVHCFTGKLLPTPRYPCLFSPLSNYGKMSNIHDPNITMLRQEHRTAKTANELQNFAT